MTLATVSAVILTTRLTRAKKGANSDRGTICARRDPWPAGSEQAENDPRVSGGFRRDPKRPPSNEKKPMKIHSSAPDVRVNGTLGN